MILNLKTSCCIKKQFNNFGLKKLKFVLLLVLSIQYEFCFSQWVQSDLTGKSVYAVASNGVKIYAGAFASGAYVSMDNGSNWSIKNYGLPSQLSSFDCFISCFTVMDTLLFAGTAGSKGAGVYVSSNEGESWTAVNQGLTQLKVTAMTSDGNNLYVGTNGGGIYWTGNKGRNWMAINTGLTNLKISTLEIFGSDIVAGTSGGGVFISNNRAASWDAANDGLTNLNIQTLLIFDSLLYVGTHGGGVFMSADHGNTWKAVNTHLSLNATIYTMHRSGNVILAGIKNHGVYITGDQAKSWSSFNDGLPNLVFTAMTCNSTFLFVGLEGKGIWKRKLTDLERTLKH